MDNPSFFLEGVVRDKDELQNFEGPLSLILLLLSKNKIEIRDISISDILDQYLEYLDKMQSMEQLKCRDIFASIQKVLPELKKASEIGMLYFSKMPEPLPPSSKEYAYRHEPVDLLKAMYSIYSRGGRSPEPDISAAVPKRIIYSVRDKSLQILHRLRDGCASLNEIYRDCRSRSEVVAAFMSILELCSMGSIHISRTENDYSLEFVGGDMDSIIDKIVE